jgi:hypothetical protein
MSEARRNLGQVQSFGVVLDLALAHQPCTLAKAEEVAVLEVAGVLPLLVNWEVEESVAERHLPRDLLVGDAVADDEPEADSATW